MGEWNIYDSSSQVKATVKKLEYNGEFMGERSITATLYSPSPIDLSVGDYLTYRNEVFSIDYDPSILKQSRNNTYGQGYVYDSVKFSSRQMELVYCKFLDYVIADNQVHYSSLPNFSFYCETITNLTERIQANLNRIYTGGKAWTITVNTQNVHVGRINIDVQGMTCWDALGLIAEKFESTFVIRGRNIVVAPSTDILTGLFQYGKGNGLRSIARTSDPSQGVVTRLRAMGNTTNMPYNYYRNKDMYVYAPITEVLGPYETSADIHTTYDFNNCFTVNTSDNQYRTKVSLDKTNWAPAIFSANAAWVGYSVASVMQLPGYDPTQYAAFMQQLNTGTYTKLYFESGISKDKWPSSYKEYTGTLGVTTGEDRLMLPTYPDVTQDPYIDSANIAKYGVREESVIFDGSNGLDDIFPTIQGMTADQARAAGATISLDSGDNGHLDEIVSATQIDDDGIPPVEGEESEMAETFSITLKDIGFNINDYFSTDNAVISMRDGKCEGREFEITECVKSGNKYVLTCKRELDDSLNRYFPYYGYNLTSGDKFVLLQIEMPELYIDTAAQRLEDAAEAYLATIDHSIYTIEPKIDNIKAKRHDDEVDSSGEGVKVYDTIYEGMLMQIEDEDLDIDDAIFIDRLTIKEGDSLIPQYEVVLRNEKVKSSIQQIQQQITDIKSGVAGVPGTGSVDVNQVNQLIKNYGDNRFLRKDIIDKLKQGVQVGDRFVSGLLGEGGVFRKNADGTTYIEADSLYIRMKAYFDTLEVRKLQYSSGNRVASAAGIKTIKVEKVGMYNNNPVVLDDDGYYHYTDGQGHEQSVQLTVTAYRCYFRMKDSDNNPIDNDFVAGDLARSQEFNLQSGLRSYWRKVVRTNGQTPDEDGLGWIDLSNVSGEYLSGSGEPTAQDDIVQLGNVNDTGRQGAIIEYSTGAGNVPSYQIYQGINTFSLDGKNYIDLGYNPTTGRAYMNVRGDFRFGSSSNNGSYINYNSSTGELSVKAAITGTSTIDGGSFDAYVKAHQNNYDDTDVYNYINEVQSDLQEQIDGAIETISDHGEPTGSNDPYASLTPQQKERHIGDMYYDLDTGYAYRYVKDGNSFYWMLIEDSDVQRAIADAAAALLMAGSKGKIFTTTAGTLPTPPYNVNDVWVNATYPSNATSTNAANHVFYNDILKCVTAMAEGGTPSINDWALASKYTDDATVNGLISQILNNTGASGDSAAAGSALYMLKKALVDGDYYQQGGLVLANLMAVRDGQTITAGINGHLDSNALGGGIAAWYGGLNLDKEDGATQNYAKSLFRFDGSGYLANGNITWDEQGRVTIRDIYTLMGSDDTDILNQITTFSNLFHTSTRQTSGGTEVLIQPMASFTGVKVDHASGYVLSDIDVINYGEIKSQFVTKSFFESLFELYNDTTPIATNGTIPADTSKLNIKAMFGFWTEKYISSLGKNDDEGGGGSTTLEGLNDVNISASVTNGQVLTYQNGEWVNAAASGGLDVNAMWNALSASTSEQINASHLSTALSGYVTSTAMTNALANYLPLTGGTLSGGLSTRTITPASNSSYSLGSNESRWRSIYTTDVYSTYFSFHDGGYLQEESSELMWHEGNGSYTVIHSGNYSEYISDTDTKNTAGSTNNTGKKLFLVGALSQAANPQTYSNSNCYIGTDNCLYSGGTKVLTSHQSLSGYATQSWVNTQLSSYLPLSGGTMTGVLTMEANQYEDARNGALNMNNSDIYGLNSIYYSDDANTQAEGEHWYRGANTVDTFRIYQGQILFAPNRTLGSTATEYTVLHTGNYSSTLDSRYVNVTGDTMTGNLTISGNGGAYRLAGSTYTIGLHLGSGGTNRGIWEWSPGNKWLFYFDANNTIMNHGNVGIGTTSPGYKLHVNGTGYFSSDVQIRNTSYGGVAFTLASTNYPDRIFSISQRNTSGSWVANYMIFGSNGYVGVGNQDPSYRLHVAGTIYATGGVTALSDMRHKDRIVDLSNDITDFADLPLFYFKYKKGEDDYLHIGTSAQAVNEILPELVAKKDIWGLDYSVLGTTLGILSARKLVNHEDRIKALEKENEELRQRIKTLEAA